MKTSTTALIKTALAALLLTASLGALAQDAVIRKNLAARIPQFPKIAGVTKTDMPGLYEVRTADADIYYTDAEGNYLIDGKLIDTRQRRDLTQERIDQLLAVNFNDLPLKDAFTIVRGNGKRQLAVFEDPNCGYCRRFERDLQKVDNVTIHVFLYPILGGDSPEKSRNIWCAKNKSQVWQDWMVRDQPAAAAASMCDASALTRNVEFGKKHKITGTPTLLFADGTRIPGAITAQQVEKQFRND